jgi:two-component sensor histidine kinase/ligand-binding sensor protein
MQITDGIANVADDRTVIPLSVSVDAPLDVDTDQLTPEVRSELLDPNNWDEILDLYAHTMKLAVALVDAQGHLVGRCHNPQPIWTLARTAKPPGDGDCLFCLETTPHCTATRDVWRTKSVVLVNDEAGFAHLAIPLLVGDAIIGTLFAGQTLSRYPDSLSLQRLARSFGLSPQQVWQLARNQPPLGAVNIALYGQLLYLFSGSFLANFYSTILQRQSAATAVALNEQLRRVLAGKETLLKEVHHRVKNNLQVISSLLNLQGATLTEPAGVAALQDSERRVLAMSLVHEQLYSNEFLEAIDFEEYAKRLVTDLLFSFGDRSKDVVSTFETSRILLEVEQAIPCGLILSELITNSLKYAYPDGGGGKLVIGLSETLQGTVTLSVSDEGCGLPLDIDFKNPKSLGLEVVSILAGQLGGTVTVQSNPGACFSVVFPRETNRRSVAVSA